MITAEIYKQAGGKIVGFVIRGHNEGGGGRGYNIRCAEVSALSQTAYLGIKRYLNRAVALDNHEHGGLGIELKDAPDDLTEAIFQAMLIGLKLVEEVAPDSVKVSVIELDRSTEENLQSQISQMKPTPVKPLPAVNVEKVKLRANIFRNDDGKINGFSVKERKTEVIDGLKIYCAAVWILGKATFHCVKNYLGRDLEVQSDSRRLLVRLKALPDDVTEAVFQTLLIGMIELEKIAPQVLKVGEITSRR